MPEGLYATPKKLDFVLCHSEGEVQLAFHFKKLICSNVGNGVDEFLILDQETLIIHSVSEHPGSRFGEKEVKRDTQGQEDKCNKFPIQLLSLKKLVISYTPLLKALAQCQIPTK